MKKMLVTLVITLMCFSLVACGGSSLKKELLGTWIGGNNSTGSESEYSGNITFNEDGTCEIKGKVYEWKVKKGDQHIEIELYDGEKQFGYGWLEELYQEKHLCNLSLYLPTNKGSNVCFRFFKESELIKVDINLGNWQEYFVKSEEMYIGTGEFDDTPIDARITTGYYFDEKKGIVCDLLTDVSLECKYDRSRCEVSVDAEAKTYSVGKVLYDYSKNNSEKKSMSKRDESGTKYGFDYPTWIDITRVEGEVYRNFEVTNIQGTLYYYVWNK